MDAKLKAAIERWKAGTPASELAVEFGTSRSEMRKRIAVALGGKAAYQAARAAGAGGRIEPFGADNQRQRPVAVAIDDAKVTTITSGKSWPVARIGKDALEVWTSPKTGIEYVRAKPSERADLIFRSKKTPSLPPLRLRKAETSGLVKKIRREQKQLKRGEAALEKTRATKREKKLARKSRQLVRAEHVAKTKHVRRKH